MTTAYTSLLGLALPVQGELAGTWGDVVNNYITQYVDAAVAGAQTISGSQTAVTLSVTTNASLSQAGSGATGSSQYQIINCTGNPGGLLTITAPAASKAYLVLNNTSTNQSVKVVGTGPTTGVTVAAAQSALIAWNGSDFELVASTDASKLTGVLGIANGGTGLSSTPTNGQIDIGNGTGFTRTTITQGSGVTITNGAGSITISATGSGGDVVGPASATDNAIVRFDGTTGKLVQNSAVTVADTTGDITGGKYNKVTITAPATGSTLTIADGKTLTANASLTLAGTDGKTLTTNASLTLAGVDGKTLTTNNSLTLAGTDGTTMTFPATSSSVGYLNIPAVADKTSSYTLATGDIGKVVGVGTGGSIEIPNSTFAAGDAVLVFNNTSAGITITCTITTAYIAGTDADKASVTLATRGLANILFISGTACVITGNVS